MDISNTIWWTFLSLSKRHCFFSKLLATLPVFPIDISWLLTIGSQSYKWTRGKLTGHPMMINHAFKKMLKLSVYLNPCYHKSHFNHVHFVKLYLQLGSFRAVANCVFIFPPCCPWLLLHLLTPFLTPTKCLRKLMGARWGFCLSRVLTGY